MYLNRSTLGRCGSVDGKLGRVPAPPFPETARDQPVNLFIVSAPCALVSAPQREFGGQYPVPFKSAANVHGGTHTHSNTHTLACHNHNHKPGTCLGADANKGGRQRPAYARQPRLFKLHLH